MTEFSNRYKSLNERQKQAVDAVEGPVLVIAGPGTGKTELLSLRVANILDKTDALGQNVLCLTFTNKAAKNMQLRLSKLIGSEAHKVTISTFHSFAAEIMNLYPEYFWQGARLSHVPDAVQLEIITDILSSLPLNNPLALKFAGQYTATRDVLDGLRLSKEAGLTPDKLRALIALNLEYIATVEPELIDICSERLQYKKLDEIAMRIESLPEQETDALTRPLVALSTILLESFEAAHTADEGTSRTRNVSAWKSRWIKTVDGQKGMHEERRRNEWWLALADVYETYRNLLHERGYYDYSDMIIEVITQMEQQPELRASVQERFQYVLIDEFQDTNAAQLRLSHLVADHYNAEGKPNIMAVGDDDQSIYKFNGAELSNMLGFTRNYPDAQIFVLTDNYRSSQAVLDVSMKIIEQASERVTKTHGNITKVLAAQNEPKIPGTIEHISYPTKDHEYYLVARHIAEIKKLHGGTIAVIARSHDSLRAAAYALHTLHVPVRYEQQQSVFQEPLVREVVMLAQLVIAINEGEEPLVNSLLSQLLAGPAWRVDPRELWQLAIENRRKPHWLNSMLDSKNDNMETIAKWLLWLSSQSSQTNASRLLEYLIGLSASEHLTSPLRQYYLEQDSVDTPYLASISGVRKLLDMAKEFSRQDQATLQDFVRLVGVTQENNQTITDESLFMTAQDAVELLTAHKAKGLEFDTVFILDAMEQIWKPSSRGRKPPANLPLKPNGDDYDDYIRLMFVAMTRAKQNLFINSYYTNENGEEALPSSIIRDILPPKLVKYESSVAPIKVLESGLIWPRLEGSEEKTLLTNILDDYRISPSAFLDFLDVAKGGPQYFLEKYLLSLPEAQSVRAAFGSAVHAALERAQRLHNDDSFSLKLVLDAYEDALIEQGLPNDEFNRYLEHGKKVIERLFTKYSMRLIQNGAPEVQLNTLINGTNISGKLDRIDELDDSIIISDYKTGNPLSSLQTKSKVIQLKAWRHRTQLELYVLMAQASGRYTKRSFKAQMVYVEAESAKDLVLQHTPQVEALERLSKLVSIVDKKIRELNLPDIRHYDPSYDGTEKFIEDLLSGKI